VEFFLTVFRSHFIVKTADKCEEEYGFAVAAGTISVVITLVMIILARFAPVVVTLSSAYVALFLVIWWFVTASVVTFRRPFKVCEIT
jgi:uncharacterized protein (DUF983 family)